MFVYADSDVTISGGTNISVSLQRGWNRVYVSSSQLTTKAPDDMKWNFEYFGGNGTQPTLGDQANFTAFTFTGIEGSATINVNSSTITAKASAATNLASIRPTFTVSKGATVRVETTSQVSGTTANNFTNPVTYTVVSEDGKTTKQWTVTITKDSGNGNGGDGPVEGAAKGAVKYKLTGDDGKPAGEMAMTFDNSKGMMRTDMWQDGQHFISIVDQKAKMMHMYYSGTWTSMPYTDSGGDDYEYTGDIATFQALPNRTIAGKTCTAWRITLKDGSAEYIYAQWEGLMMYHESVRPKGMIMEATSATLTFPDSAFSQSSINVTWL
jgi:hypothetical protein